MSLLNTENAVVTINGLLSKSAESFYEIGTVLKNLKEQTFLLRRIPIRRVQNFNIF